MAAATSNKHKQVNHYQKPAASKQAMMTPRLCGEQVSMS
jgi:hypothetical protein